MFEELVKLLIKSPELNEYVDGFYYKPSSGNRLSDNDLVFFIKNSELEIVPKFFRYLKFQIDKLFPKNPFFAYPTFRFYALNPKPDLLIPLHITTYFSLQSAFSYEGAWMMRDLLSNFYCEVPMDQSIEINDYFKRNLYSLIQLWIETNLLEIMHPLNSTFIELESLHKYHYILKNAVKIDSAGNFKKKPFYFNNCEYSRTHSLELLNKLIKDEKAN